MIDADELAAARADAQQLLPSSCVIYTEELVPDGGGAFEQSWTPGDPMPCRLAPAGGGEGNDRGGRISERTTHVLTLPAETPIDESAQVEVAGVRYEVTLVRKRPDLEVARRVEVREAGG